MSLRIIGPNNSSRMRTRSASDAIRLDSYLERVAKLVPAEAIAAFPMLNTVAGENHTIAQWAQPAVAWALLGVVVLLRSQATRGPESGAQWGAVVISVISYFIWVNAIGGEFGLRYLAEAVFAGATTESVEDSEKFLTFLALVVWTMVVPVFYRGQR